MFCAMPCWPEAVARLRMKIRSDVGSAGDATAVAEQCTAGDRTFGIASEHADPFAALGEVRGQGAEQAALSDAAAAGQGDDGRSTFGKLLERGRQRARSCAGGRQRQ